MSAPQVNQPLNVQDFKYQFISIAPSTEDQSACQMPQTNSWSKLIKDNKTVVITGAPAAFSPTCSVSHIPAYISHLNELVEEKKVDQIIVVTVDNPFANQAWAKTLGVEDTTHIKFASDAGAKFIRSLGYELKIDDDVYWSGRWSIVVKDGIVTYAGIEENPATDVTVSSVENVLASL